MRALAYCGLIAATSLLHGQALAAIKPSLFCIDGRVDRGRLAMAALSEAGVSYFPIVYASTAAGDYAHLPPAVRILAHASFCDQVAGPQSPPACAEGDDVKIQKARSYVDDLFRDRRFGKPAGLERTTYLRSNDAAISCPELTSDTVALGAPPTAPKQPDIGKVPLRIRGSTDGLQFARGSTQFPGLEKATISFTDDRKDRKESFAATGVVGLAVPIGSSFEAVPYFGFSIDKSTKFDDPATPTDEASETISKDTVRAGMQMSYRLVGPGGTHYFLLRPEFAGNSVERSEVFTANFAYVPVLSWLNSYAFEIRDESGRILFQVMPRGELRSTYGNFIKAGTRLPEASVDFLRVGGQFGATLSSDLSWLPIDLTVTETYFHGLRGEPEDLGQLKLVLSANFDAKKYFGIDVSFVRGRAEDLLDRSDKWTIGLGAKF